MWTTFVFFPFAATTQKDMSIQVAKFSSRYKIFKYWKCINLWKFSKSNIFNCSLQIRHFKLPLLPLLLCFAVFFYPKKKPRQLIVQLNWILFCKFDHVPWTELDHMTIQFTSKEEEKKTLSMNWKTIQSYFVMMQFLYKSACSECIWKIFWNWDRHIKRRKKEDYV